MFNLSKFIALPLLSSLFPSPSRQALGLILRHTPLKRNHSIFLLSLSRRSFLSSTLPTLLMSTAMASSSNSFYSPTHKSVYQAIQLLNSVYGPVSSTDFPLPMRSSEAGPCPAIWNTVPLPHSVQHRYLWTDAFAVLAYQSLAEYYNVQDNEKEATVYQEAVERLITVVHSCLGTPRSGKVEDRMTPCNVSPTGYVGLRIGKVGSQKVTDYGMQYDGQYWHYIDKWLLAMARTNHVEDGIRIAKSCFPYFFSSGKHGSGIRWKLSVDASPPPSLQHVHGPNDDTLNALIVFSMLEKQNQSTKLSLKGEIQSLQTSLNGYHPRVTDDPLGWGLESLFDQFVMGNPRLEQLRLLAPEVLRSTHLPLPFRLYGALIGALVVPSSALGLDGGNGSKKVSSKYLQELLDVCVDYQFQEIKKELKGRYKEEHSSINRTMLAMALLSPGALGKRYSDPPVQF